MVTLLVLAGCPKAAPEPPALAGGGSRIWSVAEGRWSTEEALLRDLEDVEFVLLGENHDNPEHHLLQAKLITAVEPLSVGFEMLDDTDPLDAPNPAKLAEAVGWADSGWPSFDLYRPVFEATFAAYARIVAANPSRAEVDTVMEKGVEALPREAVSGLRLDKELPAAERAELAAEIAASHAGETSPDTVEKMVRAQVLKDMWMARALGMSSRPSVLIAGGGHTRKDRGVPLYLQGDVRVIRFVEMGQTAPDPASTDEGADWLWFTSAR